MVTMGEFRYARKDGLPALFTRMSTWPNSSWTRLKAFAMDSSDVISMESGSAVDEVLGDSRFNLDMASLARLMSPRHPMRMWYGSGRENRAFATSNPE